MRTIYNTTFIIDEAIENEWLVFMKEQYLPVLKEYGNCADILLTQVSIDQPEGKTYSLQLIFNSEKNKDHCLQHCLPALEEKIICRYANRYVCFSSLLTEI